ncbi:hypothetical protein GCM10017717_43610 [Deinococcus persicinus]
MRFPLSLTHQTPLVNTIQFDASVADIAKRWKLSFKYFLLGKHYIRNINHNRDRYTTHNG